MGGLSRRVKCIREHGVIDITSGHQEVRIDLDFLVTDVYVSCVSSEFPICQGDLNYLAVTVLDGAFVLDADVRTGSAQVRWMAVGMDGSDM